MYKNKKTWVYVEENTLCTYLTTLSLWQASESKFNFIFPAKF